MAVRDRIARGASWMRSLRPAPAPRSTPAAPLWVRGLTAGGRPIVLGVALLMCAPGEYHLALAAGWSRQFAYGMPVVLSAYAGIASAVASVRRRGDRGRWSAIIGAVLALALAMAAQVVSHLIKTGHVPSNLPALIAVTSIVPPAVVGHLLHLAASPPGRAAQDVPQDTEDAPATPPSGAVLAPSVARLPLVPASAALLPLVARSQADQDAAELAELRASVPVLLSTRQLADREGVAPSTVRNWVRDGRVTPTRTDDVGRHWFNPDTAITAAVAS